jgi:hypothetical protein
MVDGLICGGFYKPGRREGRGKDGRTEGRRGEEGGMEGGKG